MPDEQNPHWAALWAMNSACSCATVNSLYAVGAAVAQLPLNVEVRATTTDGTSRMIATIASTFLRMSLLLPGYSRALC